MSISCVICFTDIGNVSDELLQELIENINDSGIRLDSNLTIEDFDDEILFYDDPTEVFYEWAESNKLSFSYSYDIECGEYVGEDVYKEGVRYE